MKEMIISLALTALVGVSGCALTKTAQAINEVVCADENCATDGMYFSTRYIVGYIEDEGRFALIYSNPDQNLWDCEIEVDWYTYAMCVNALHNNLEITGELCITLDENGENFIFSYAQNPEYEMAESSAK